jgi:preprotein translocase subunit SecD
MATVDMDKIVRVVEGRLNGGAEELAAVRKLDDRRIEVTLLRRDDADRQCVERRLTRPGTLEFRILANKHVDKALTDRVQKDPARREVLDPSGKRLAWWVPVRAGSERGFDYPEIARRTRKAGDREVTEILVVADPHNVTGAYLTQARLQFDRFGQPNVSFTFNDAGGELVGKLTGDHLPNDSTGVSYWLGILIDGELLSAPRIRSKIGNRGEISGSFTEIEASDLAAVLNAGSLPVRLRLVGQHP